MNRSRRPWTAMALAGLITALPAAGAGAAGKAVDQRPLAIAATPITFSPFDSARTRFGRLEWRGGVKLTSDDDRFGGLSGIVLSADGRRMVAVSDKGWWLEARLDYAQGRIAAVTGARMARLLDRAGRPLRGKKNHDAESLAAYGPTLDGDLLVAFERRTRVLRYPYGRDGMAARPRPLAAPAEMTRGPDNKELEAVGRFAASGPMKGAVVAISERQLDANGNILGWIFRGSESRRIRFARVDDFDITDLAIDERSQTLFTLERRFSPFTGVGMLIRRFDARTLRSGAPLAGEVLFRANQTLNIDNMEGLAATRTADGEILLTVISDDNHNVLQRTLLLQFAVK